MVSILTRYLIKGRDGFGHLIYIALRAPGLSISAAVVAATSSFTTSSVCVPFAGDNHRLFDALNHLMISLFPLFSTLSYSYLLPAKAGY